MFRIFLLNYVFFGIIALHLPTSLLAHQVSGLKIIAIVLSKTCPLPDGPDMTIDSPDSILKSVTIRPVLNWVINSWFKLLYKIKASLQNMQVLK